MTLDLKASTELEFPSVTVCNLNPIKEKYTEHDPYTPLQQYSEPDTSDILVDATKENWQFRGIYYSLKCVTINQSRMLSPSYTGHAKINQTYR